MKIEMIPGHDRCVVTFTSAEWTDMKYRSGFVSEVDWVEFFPRKVRERYLHWWLRKLVPSQSDIHSATNAGANIVMAEIQPDGSRVCHLFHNQGKFAIEEDATGPLHHVGLQGVFGFRFPDRYYSKVKLKTVEEELRKLQEAVAAQGLRIISAEVAAGRLSLQLEDTVTTLYKVTG